MKLPLKKGGRSGDSNNMGLGLFRNKKCYCGSNLKFKKCHWLIDAPTSVAGLQEQIRSFQVRKAIEQQAKEVVAKNEKTISQPQP